MTARSAARGLLLPILAAAVTAGCAGVLAPQPEDLAARMVRQACLPSLDGLADVGSIAEEQGFTPTMAISLPGLAFDSAGAWRREIGYATVDVIAAPGGGCAIVAEEVAPAALRRALPEAGTDPRISLVSLAFANVTQSVIIVRQAGAF